jgi:hypothetical protein
VNVLAAAQSDSKVAPKQTQIKTFHHTAYRKSGRTEFDFRGDREVRALNILEGPGYNGTFHHVEVAPVGTIRQLT